MPPSFANDGFLSRDTFQQNFALSMNGLYGSDFKGFSEGGFVWSGEMDMKLLIPRANLIGAMYKGSIFMGQLPARNAPLTPALSLNQLIKIAQQTELSDSVWLKSAVVNHNLIYDSQTLTSDITKANPLAGE